MDSRPTVVAFAGERHEYRQVTDYAAGVARRQGARLILYDIDAAGLQAPLPTIWSAEGTTELFDSGLLDADMLEGVGRQELAAEVRRYDAEGVETFGWLPETASISALADYAASQDANVIVVPAHSDHRTLLDRMRGRDTSELSDQTSIDVVVVGNGDIQRR
jgi:nucleotide-binding universal stress UspA family protein